MTFFIEDREHLIHGILPLNCNIFFSEFFGNKTFKTNQTRKGTNLLIKRNNISSKSILWRIVKVKILRDYLFADLSEPPFPVLVVMDGLVKLLLGEIGPEGIGKIKFRIGYLP